MNQSGVNKYRIYFYLRQNYIINLFTCFYDSFLFQNFDKIILYVGWKLLNYPFLLTYLIDFGLVIAVQNTYQRKWIFISLG